MIVALVRGMSEFESRHRDWLLFLVASTLVVLGLRYIHSTDWVGPSFAVGSKWRWQAGWACLGGGLMLCARFVDYRRTGLLIAVLYSVAVVCLVVVSKCGPEINGARRWLFIGKLSFQPSGVARFVTLVAYSYWITAKCPFELPRGLHRLIACAIILVPAGLIFIQPAVGNAITLVIAAVVVWLVHTADHRLVRRLLIILAVGFLLILAELHWVRAQDLDPDAFMDAFGWWPYGHHVYRISWFLSPTGSWNGRQSVLCLAAGGVTGKGDGRGFLQILGYLPRGVSSSDFILAVIGEEAGFLGCALVVALYAILVALGYRIAAFAKDEFGRLIATGITSIFALHTVINLLMTTRMCPIIGLPLPFLSKGGTFLCMSLLGAGVMSAIHRQSKAQEQETAACERCSDTRPDGVYDAVLIDAGPLFKFAMQVPQSTVRECASSLELTAVKRTISLLEQVGGVQRRSSATGVKRRRRRRKRKENPLQRELPHFTEALMAVCEERLNGAVPLKAVSDAESKQGVSQEGREQDTTEEQRGVSDSVIAD